MLRTPLQADKNSESWYCIWYQTILAFFSSLSCTSNALSLSLTYSGTQILYSSLRQPQHLLLLQLCTWIQAARERASPSSSSSGSERC